MPNQPVDFGPSLDEGDDLLDSSSYSMRPLSTRNTYPDEVENSAGWRQSSSLTEGTPVSQCSEDLEEGIVDARLKSITAHLDRPRWLAAARAFYAVEQWVRGPQPPRPYRVTPILSQLQTFPLNSFRRFFPRGQQRFCLLVAIFLLWSIIFVGLLSISVLGCQIPGYRTPVRLSCISRFW